MDAKTAAFNAATAATYSLRNSSDLDMPRNRKAAAAAVGKYAEIAGLDLIDAINEVCNWLDARFSDLDAAEGRLAAAATPTKANTPATPDDDRMVASVAALTGSAWELLNTVAAAGDDGVSKFSRDLMMSDLSELCDVDLVFVRGATCGDECRCEEDTVFLTDRGRTALAVDPLKVLHAQYTELNRDAGSSNDAEQLLDSFLVRYGFPTVLFASSALQTRTGSNAVSAR